MQNCSYCEKSFVTQTAIREHILICHPREKPYKCNLCSSEFKHKSSLVRHKDVLHKTEQITRRDTVRGETPPCKKRKIPIDQACSDFHAWCQQSVDRPSESTASAILSLIRSHPQLQNISWNDVSNVEHAIFTFEDKCHTKKLQIRTIANYLRQLLTYARYLEETQNTEVHEICLASVMERVHELQSASTRLLIRQNCLAILDPYKLAGVRNNVVDQLNRIQKKKIDPFVSVVLSGSCEPRTPECIKFGVDHLRCWIDLCLRFCNVPCRMQVTSHMVLPDHDSGDFVSKLSYRKSQFVRIVNLDKTCKVHQPLSIPVGPYISWYIEFYLRYCRPTSELPFVFLTKNGAQWRQSSKDVKSYLQTVCGISPNQIDPTGRFVHGSRHIVLASYALRVNFDEHKLRNFALLMRHSIQTAIGFYNIWTDVCRARKAVVDFAQALGLPDCKDMTAIETPNMVYANLNRPSAIIRHMMASMMNVQIDVESSISIYSVKDASTQTGPLEKLTSSAQSNVVQNSSSAFPNCTTCHQRLRLHGPCGSKRNQYFGRYFLQCMQCYPKKRITRDARVFELGYTPPHGLKSVSSTPRNIKSILQFISTNTE